MNEIECTNCNGRGWLWASRNPNNTKQDECEDCHGAGKVVPKAECCDCGQGFPKHELGETDWGLMCKQCESAINSQNQGA